MILHIHVFSEIEHDQSECERKNMEDHQICEEYSESNNVETCEKKRIFMRLVNIFVKHKRIRNVIPI